jgi:uracil-DNA glycosylase family 4
MRGETVNAGFRLLAAVQREVVGCEACPRLRKYCAKVAEEKRRAYREWTYWGRPVPSFGDPSAGLLIIGLAPGAHGANRTGRMFTGDPSGDFLFRVLHRTGFASQPASRSRDDGLSLHGAYVTAAVRCAPPDNKPLPGEIRNCRRYLERELELLDGVEVIVALGRIAFDVYLSVLRDQGLIRSRAAFPFAHGREHRIHPSLPVLISSYHPNQQNTSTGRLTEEMLYSIFARVKEILRVKSADIQPSKLE